MFRNALLARRVSNLLLKSPSVQKFSFSSQQTKNLSELSSQEASTLLNSLNILHHLDGMCLSLVKNQSDLIIPDIKFRALQKHLERFKIDGVPLELIQSSSSETIVSPSLSEAVKTESSIVKPTEEETNKEPTSLLLPGFTVMNKKGKPTSEDEVLAHHCVKKGDRLRLDVFLAGINSLF
jgi:hypothetical protein